MPVQQASHPFPAANLAAASGALGPPVYSSPEQLEFSGSEVDNRSDIYSLGALLYELLCGRPPFDQKRLSELSLESM